MVLALDACGVCDGDDSTCTDCAGVVNGESVLDSFGVCGGSNDLQAAIDSAEAGSTLTVPSGTYGPVAILKSLSLLCEGECVIDASGSLSGVTIGDPTNSMDVNGVIVDGFTITGDSSTNSGVMVLPRTSDVTVSSNTISGMALANPGNDSPLSYGVLAFGGSSYMPSSLTIKGNTITNVSGSGISLGSNTMNVDISDNTISDIIPVDLAGVPFSVGVQAQAAIGLNVEGNTFGGTELMPLGAAVNVIASQGTMSGNSFNSSVGSYLSVSDLYMSGVPVAQSAMTFNEEEAYWLATTSAYSDLLGMDVVTTSYATSLLYASLAADAGSTITGSDGSETVQDCTGDWFGTAVIDDCGVCGGDGTSCITADITAVVDLMLLVELLF